MTSKRRRAAEEPPAVPAVVTVRPPTPEQPVVDEPTTADNGPHILVVGDVHIGATDAKFIRKVLDFVLQAVRVLPGNLAAIVLLGDLIDSLKLWALVIAEQWVRELAKEAPVYLLVGNHERPTNATCPADQHPYHGLAGCPNVHVIDEPMRTTIGGRDFIMVPYLPPGQLATAMQSLGDMDTVCTVYLHASLNDVQEAAPLQNYINRRSSDPWPATHPLAVCGHWHLWKWYSNILFPGPPYQVRDGEPADSSILLCRYSDSDTPSTIQERLSGRVILCDALHPMAKYFQAQRIMTRMPVRVHTEIRAAGWDALDLAPSETVLRHTITVTGSTEELHALLARPDVRKAQREPHLRIHTVYEHNFVPQERVAAPDRVSFLQVLRKRAEANGLADAFADVFA